MTKEMAANPMEATPIPKLVMKRSVPLMVSMLVSSLYGMVDSMFVARISEKALAATTVAFPITLFLFAIAIGTAMGVNSRLSRFLGEGEMTDAKETGWTGILLSVLSSIPFMLIGAFGLPFIYKLITADPEIAVMGQVYTRIILLFCIGQFFASMGARLLQATGYASLSMAAQLTGSILNCILDPIMIFGLFGFPALGIEGAAIATVLSQCISGTISTALYFIKNPQLRLKSENLRMRVDLVGEIYKVGVPMMIVTALNSVMMVATNRILEGVSSTAIAFYGVFGKLQNFMFMPVNGLSQGIVPIVGYFYGAKNAGKIRETVKFSLKIAVGVMSVGMVVFFLFPNLLMAIYDASPAMLEIGQVGLRALATAFIPLGFVLVLGNVFTALGNGMLNMKCSMIRGGLPVILLLPMIKLVGTTWCWLAFILADYIAAVLAIYSYKKLDKTKLENLS